MKRIFAIVALVVCAAVIKAFNVTPASDIPGYYASLDGKYGKSLFDALATVTVKGKTEIGYNGLYDAYKKTDIYPADSTAKKGLVWDMYSDCAFEFDNTCGEYSNECDCYNREHSIPQSWWGGGTADIGNDIFHVVPTDGKINGMRNNYCYGEVTGKPDFISMSGHKRGTGNTIVTARKTIATTAGEAVAWTGGDKDYVFEPIDRYKGDLARGIMGTMLAWEEDLTGEYGRFFFQSAYTSQTNWGLTKYGVALLMKWHRQDPVSQKEIDRNNGIQATQGNRNPFIDYPYLAEYIWGEHAGEVVTMADLIASCEKGFIPELSDGWRDEPLDPNVPKYGVNWSVNGEIIHTDSVSEKRRVSSLPETPVSCSDESDTFVGWTTTPIEGTSENAPAVLYTNAKDMPVVTADVTYYAVFAHVETEGASTPATYEYYENHTEGWTTPEWEKKYCLLTKGKEIVSPEVELVGLKSITITMRTYSGNDNATVSIIANNQTIGTLTASNNKLNPYKWTNSGKLNGTTAIHFKADKSSTQGVGISVIEIDATGSTTVRSRFMTTCGTVPQSIEQTEIQPEVQKVLINGQLYIISGDHIYNIIGQKIL